VGGMGRSLQSGNSVIVSAFHTALFHQFLFLLAVGAVLAIGFNVLRTIQYRRLEAVGRTTFPTAQMYPYPEPAARRILRIGFGLIWVLDGLLQLQASMPLDLPSGVIQPAANSSPPWVQHLVNSGVTIWSNHPVQAAAATVWIQVGLGIWILVAPRGRWSRLGGLASAGWGLVVWIFGEAFGGIFAPGLTWLFGAPGAVVFYCVAGLLLALPERAFRTPRLGRIVLACSGAFFLGMAVLQTWPGRGFWQGRIHASSHVGTLTGMVQQMAQTPQPGFLSSWVAAFAAFDAAHGWAVNLVVVVALAAIGIALCTGRRRFVIPALIGAVALCLADWVLVEDLGFLGGVGTDPNSMVPMALVLAAGYVAMVRLAVPVDAPAPVPEATEAALTAKRWWERATPSYVLRTVAAVGAVAVVLMGTAPMAVAAINPNADPILSEALDGTPNTLDTPAPQFHLIDQQGNEVSLAGLRGQEVVLTFLDPVCTSDCPLIAQEMRQADQRLGTQAHNVDFVAIVANPIYRSVSFTNAFDRQESLNHLANWYYLTGSVSQLQRVWNAYGVLVGTVPAGSMIAHSDLAFVIDAQGRERDVLVDDPGPTNAFASSFSSLLLDRIDQVLHS
jgi:cytochrome oxidase Cu insertion factor (SCO1/SenC/PrrC family)